MYSDLLATTEIYDSGLQAITAAEAADTPVGWDSYLWGSAAANVNNLGNGLNINPNYAYWLDAPVDNVQSIKIVLDVPAEQVEIGRLIIGDYIEPTYGVGYNHKLEWKETSKQYRTAGSTLRSDVTTPIRKMEFSLGTINETDRTLLQEGLRYVGLRNDFYISIFPEDSDSQKERDYSAIVKLTKEPSMSEYANLYYNSKYVVEEV